MEKNHEKDLAESVVKAIEEDVVNENEMESSEGGRNNNNCHCTPTKTKNSYENLQKM